MKRASCFLCGLVVLTACASGGGGSSPFDTPAEEGVVLIVLNELMSPLTAYAEWGSGQRIRLGEVGAGSRASFTTPIRSSDVRVVAVPVGRSPSGQPAAGFATVRPGDRIEWRFTAAGPQPYMRLPSQ